MQKIQTIAQLKDAINAMLNYNWDDEEEDYKRHKADSHIFVTMQALADWVDE